MRASPGFALAVLVTLGLAGLIGLMTLLMSVLGGFLGMAHFTEAAHRIHDLTYGFLFTAAVAGLLVQLRRPSENVAGMVMALIPWVALLLAAILSTDAGVILSAERMLVAVGTVTAVVLHPAGRDFFRSFTVSRINWVMLGLVVLAAVPLVVFASSNVALQGTATNEHAGMGHYGFLAAFGFTVIGAGVLASLRPDGWKLTAWVAGFLPALFGLASVLYPEVDSSLSTVWAIVAIAWGALFVASAELTRHAESQTQPIAGAKATSATGEIGGVQMTEPREIHAKAGMPRWVKVSAMIVGVALVLLVVLMRTGVLGEHGPGQSGPGQHGP